MTKLAPFRQSNQFNVVTYGAVGDGNTDDTAAVQAAIDAAGLVGTSASRAIVYFPPIDGDTTYFTTRLNMVSNVELRGPFTFDVPRPTTWTVTLKRKPGEGPGGQHSFIRCENQTNVSFRYLAFDYDGANQTTGFSHYFTNTPNGVFQSCYFVNSTRDPYGSPAIQTNDAGCYNWQVLDCTSLDCDSLVGFMDGGYDCLVDNCHCTGGTLSEQISFYQIGAGAETHHCTCTNTTFVNCKTAFAFQGHVHDCLCANNTFENCQYSILFDDGAYDNIARDCTITGGANATGQAVSITAVGSNHDNLISNVDITSYTTAWPVMLAGTDNTMDGCTINGSDLVVIIGDGAQFTNNTLTSPVAQGIFLNAAKTGINLSGNTVTGAGNTGIYIHAAQTSMTLTGNTVTGCPAWAAGISIDVTGGSYTFVGNHSHGQSIGVDVHAGATGTYDGTNDMTGNTSGPDWGGLTAV